VLPADGDTIRLFLHLTAAAMWVGGQFTVAGLLGTVRGFGDDAPRAVARAFARLAWPAYGVLVVTGIWNLLAVEVGDQSSEYMVTLAVKVLVVVASGAAAAAHAMSRSRAVLAMGGAVAGVTALAAVFLGVMLAGA
jgi:putative copper export protein